MKQIEELAAAALGIDSKRGDLLAVENLSFQNLQEDAPAPPTLLEKVQRRMLGNSGRIGEDRQKRQYRGNSAHRGQCHDHGEQLQGDQSSLLPTIEQAPDLLQYCQ